MKKSAVILGVTVGLGALVSVSSKRVEPAEAAPAPKKVTICHRTHATTNPYVRITVSESSISNAANKHGGSKHDQYPTGSSKPSPNVFNPATNYASNQKKWGDIIPNVYTDGTPFTAAGSSTNFTGIGVSIWNGTAPYTDTCKAKSARDLYELEKANGVPESEILEDLEESGADEFANALNSCGGTFLGCTVDKLGAPTSTTTTVAGSTATTVAGATTTTAASSTVTTSPTSSRSGAASLAPGTGGLQTRIWIDSNRNGKKDSSEKYLGDITVTIEGPGGVTATQTTDDKGYVLFTDLAPGSWKVVSSLPSGTLQKVYDADGTPNWRTSLKVAAGEVASTKFAAASSTAVDSDSLPATGTSVPTWMAFLGALLMSFGVWVRRLTQTA